MFIVKQTASLQLIHVHLLTYRTLQKYLFIVYQFWPSMLVMCNHSAVEFSILIGQKVFMRFLK